MKALVVSSVLPLTACGDAVPTICDRPSTPEPIPYKEADAEPDLDVYMSAPWDGSGEVGLLHWPGGAFVSFFHGMDAVPSQWSAYLSFDRHGTSHGGSLSQGFGDAVLFKGMDATTITLINSSCVEYWILVRVER